MPGYRNREGVARYAHVPPKIDGWHSEAEEAARQGVHIQTLRKQRALGEGNVEFIKVHRFVLYKDGSAERLAEKQLREKFEGPRGPGRPRKVALDAAE